jgi:hypothetical protein
MVSFIDVLYDIDFEVGLRGVLQAPIERTNGDSCVPYRGDSMALLRDNPTPEVGGEVAR